MQQYTVSPRGPPDPRVALVVLALAVFVHVKKTHS